MQISTLRDEWTRGGIKRDFAAKTYPMGYGVGYRIALSVKALGAIENLRMYLNIGLQFYTKSLGVQ